MYRQKHRLFNKQIIFGHLFTLLIGLFIYFAFRPTSIIAFKWFVKVFQLDIVLKFREITQPYAGFIPDWMIYSLPDGLWMFSFMSLILFVWNNTITKQNAFWIFALPLMTIFAEIGQLSKIIPGTFDYMDIFLFFVGTFLPIFIYSNSKRKTFNHE